MKKGDVGDQVGRSLNNKNADEWVVCVLQIGDQDKIKKKKRKKN